MAVDTHLCFRHLLGQDKAKKFLLRSLGADRIPHAYMFKGPDGVGKKLFARGVAMAVNCRDETSIGACGRCGSCLKYRSMNHPDFLVIQPEKGVIKIDQIRRMSRELSYPPYESTMRVVVLEDVHTMRREAANSLLKTLEEPPQANLLVLTAESSREVLATLSSRCQVVPFFHLRQSDTVTILVQQGVDPEVAPLLARLSEGSPGAAMRFEKTEMVTLCRGIIDLLTNTGVDPDRDAGKLLLMAEQMALLKDDLPALLGLLKVWLRDLLVGESAWGADGKKKKTPAKYWSSNTLFAKLRAVELAEQQLLRNCNRNLVCEVLLFTLQ